LRKEPNKKYYQEEQFWNQKSRLEWANNGDRNTKFFHAATKNRRAQNWIQKLVDDEGKEWHNDMQFRKVAEAYFKKVFASKIWGINSKRWQR